MKHKNADLFWSDSYMIQKEKDPSKAHQIKLEVIVKAFKWLEIDMDIDEVIFIVSVFVVFTDLTPYL